MVGDVRGTLTLKPENEGKGGLREQVSIQFTGSPSERDTNFGEFCVALTKTRTRFTIAGDRTLIMDKETVEYLYGEPRALYEKLLKNEQIHVEPVTVTGRRYRKSREESLERARWYMQNR
jgi:hypothetical protein